MRKYALKKNSETGEIPMSVQNLKICAQNQQGFETLYLNDSLQLQYCNFAKIQNLQQCICTEEKNQALQNGSEQNLVKQTKGVNTLFLNNNIVQKIENLDVLSRTLVTLNLSNNRIADFFGLRNLANLAVLDLSHNKIRNIHKEEISPLIKLKRLNLNANLFTDQSSIEAITLLKHNLETLELANNQSFQPQITILSEVFGQMTQLTILVLKETPFVRSTSAYRKQVILAVQSLNYLDDRPVTSDERLLAKAWKRGGLKEQQQARKLIREKIDQKNKNIMQEIEERNKIVDNKAEKIFFMKGKQLITELQSLKSLTKSEDFDLLTSEEESVLQLKIQQLERYLELLRDQCKGLDLDKELGIRKEQLPKMLVEKRTGECIYIYNVNEEQLELIKQKYYPEETLPLKAINYEKAKEIQWLTEYSQMLDKLYRILKGNWDLILPSFNLDVYDYDLNSGRKLRRFSLPQIKKKFEEINLESFGEKESNVTYINANQLASPNQLDCLD